MSAPASASARPVATNYDLGKVIAASSAGTMIEWYDFYIFGSLAAIISRQFYPQGNEFVSLLATLATFATGFVVRPFGAVVFGRIGDLVGRKYTFLLTLIIMGTATTVIGILPTYDQIGVLAPVMLVLLRLAQGLALGGEYGGAAIYVAEHAPDGRRGFYTSFIQTTATLGLFISLAVIIIVRLSLGEAAFADWGWRIPFLLSALLVAMSYYIRMSLQESPLFQKLKDEGKTSSDPLKEGLFNRTSGSQIALALFGATAGQACVWYTGQFYSLFFLQNTLKLDLLTSNMIVAIALLIGTPFFIYFGDLSDKIGRKKIMMTANLVAALTFYPVYAIMLENAANPVLLTVLVLYQVLLVTAVYGPIAAFLIEMFPGRVRYTSLSVPYHLGNGVFGGLTPFIATAIVGATGNPLAGLVYPISVAIMTFIIGSLYLRETKDVRIWDEVGGQANASAD